MSAETTLLSKSAAELRLQFDNTFVAPPPGPAEGNESLITLRAAGEALAVKMLHITAVAKRRRIVPVPTRVPGLLGITVLRGTLLPVYDLAAILGLPAPAGERSWLMLTGPETTVGLIFDEFEGQIEIDRACLYESGSSGSRKHLRVTAKVNDTHRAVIDIPGIVEEIRKTAGVLEPAKEYTK